ncbi:MAG: hypothetical protein Q9217_001600 [Psora testacea]
MAAGTIQKVKDTQPLKIIVAGAGIAGLCAAVSLRQAGHTVEIFEKSKFATEIGAALALSPNGVRVLRSLGFCFERAQARRMSVWESVNGTDLKRISAMDFKDAEDRYGAPFMAVHRVDLHKELLRLALDEGGKGQPALLKLDKAVETVHPVEGRVELVDGTAHSADLIIAADGLHSVVRSAVMQAEASPTHSGLSAFRFLASTELLKKDESIKKLLNDWKVPGATILADTTDTVNERHMVCGNVQNFVGIHPTRDATHVMPESMKDGMIQEFGHFHPDIVKILRASEDVKCWPLFIHEPISEWRYGKVVLIGDAAHPMLPFGGQGSNQAIEDGGALGYLLKGVAAGADTVNRLKMFEEVRRNRASRVQILSKTRIGNEKDVESQLKKFAEGDDKRVPGSFPERIEHDFGFNVLGRCEEILGRA